MNPIIILLLVISVIESNEHIDCFVQEFSKLKSEELFKNMKTFALKNLFMKGLRKNIINMLLEKKVIDGKFQKIKKMKNYTYEFDFNVKIGDLVEHIHSENYLSENKYFSEKISKNYCENGFLKFGFFDNKISKFFCQNSTTEEIMGFYFRNNFSHHFYLIKIFQEAFKPLRKFYDENKIINYSFKIGKEDYYSNEKIKKKVLNGFFQVLKNLKITIYKHLEKYHKNLKHLFVKLEKKFNGPDNKFRKLQIEHKPTKEFFMRRMNINFSSFPERIINQMIPIINKNKLNFPIEKKINIYYMNSYFNYLYRKTKQDDWNTNYYFHNLKELQVTSIVNFLSKLNPKFQNRELNIFKEVVIVVDNIFDTVISKDLKFDLSLLEFNKKFFENLKVKFNYKMSKWYNEKIKRFNFFLLSPKAFRLSLLMLFRKTIKQEIDKLNKVINYLKEKQITNHEDLCLYLIFYTTLNHLPHLHKIIKTNILKNKSAKEIIEKYEKFNIFYKETKYELYNVVDTVDSKIKYEIYYQYFMKRISYSIILQFPEHKNLILKTLPHVFDKKILNFKDLFIYYKLINLKFMLAIENLDFIRNNEKNLKKFIVNVFQNIITSTNEEIFQIDNYFKKKKIDLLDDFSQIQRPRFIFKFLYLNLIKKNNLNNIKVIPFDEKERGKKKQFIKILKQFKFSLYNKILHINSKTNDIESLKKFDLFKYKIDNESFEMVKNDKNSEFQEESKLKVLENLITNSIYLNEKDEIKNNFKFLVEHFDLLPNNIKNVITKCGNLFKDGDFSEKDCLSHKIHKSKRCFRANPYLIVQSCHSTFPKSYKKSCLESCPPKFIESGNGTCIKPEVYMINENENCADHFERIEHMCFPRCPLGWKDFGNSCEKGEKEKIKKYFHDSILSYVK